MPIKLYKRGDLWHYRGTVAGRRLRGSTGTPNKDIAAQVAAKKESAAWKCHIHGPEAVLTFAQAAMLYRAAGKETRFLPKIEDHWRDTPVKDINAGAIRQSALTLYPDASGATRNRHVIAPTQAIINHAAESKLCARVTIKRFKVEKKVKIPADWAWIETFMAACPKLPHLAALACFKFLTGARISEALAIEWRHVDLAKQTVIINATKIGSERLSHLPQPLLIALANIKRGPGRPVFQYLSKKAAEKSWKAAVARAGIAKLSFHSCRHGFATAMLRAGVDIVTVAKLGGWKNPQHVFQTYGHASDDLTLTDRIGTDLTQREIGAVKKRVVS